MTECFKSLQAFPRYAVSTHGRVLSLKNGKQVILKPFCNTDGYHLVVLSNNGKPKTLQVHRLVMLSFVGESALHVDHINNDKSDNRVENLRYVTIRDNNVLMGLSRPKSSKFTGVYFNNTKNLWQSGIVHNRRRIYIGRFKTEEEASRAYLNVCDDLGIPKRFEA